MGGGEGVAVRGTPHRQDPEALGRQIRNQGCVFPTSSVGNKGSGQSTSSTLLIHVRAQARYALVFEPVEKVSQGSTIKLHDYKALHCLIFCTSLSTLRNPPGNQCGQR